jgi:hypothetical protein
MPLYVRLLCHPGVSRDAQDISAEYFHVFRNAVMVNCKLLYTEWQQTRVSPDLILANKPEWPNIQHELMEALRVNALSQGDGLSARKYLIASMRASIEHQRRIVQQHDHYYAGKYTLRQPWCYCCS